MPIIQKLNKLLLNATFDKALNIAFNDGMDDKTLIESLGGPTKVCELLGYDKSGGVQRVQNWITRGIPPKVKLEHPEIFLRKVGAGGTARQLQKAA